MCITEFEASFIRVRITAVRQKKPLFGYHSNAVAFGAPRHRAKLLASFFSSRLSEISAKILSMRWFGSLYVARRFISAMASASGIPRASKPSATDGERPIQAWQCTINFALSGKVSTKSTIFRPSSRVGAMPPGETRVTS
jgi:hypothetical protein